MMSTVTTAMTATATMAKKRHRKPHHKPGKHHSVSTKSRTSTMTQMLSSPTPGISKMLASSQSAPSPSIAKSEPSSVVPVHTHSEQQDSSNATTVHVNHTAIVNLNTTISNHHPKNNTARHNGTRFHHQKEHSNSSGISAALKSLFPTPTTILDTSTITPTAILKPGALTRSQIPTQTSADLPQTSLSPIAIIPSVIPIFRSMAVNIQYPSDDVKGSNTQFVPVLEGMRSEVNVLPQLGGPVSLVGEAFPSSVSSPKSQMQPSTSGGIGVLGTSSGIAGVLIGTVLCIVLILGSVFVVYRRRRHRSCKINSTSTLETKDTFNPIAIALPSQAAAQYSDRASVYYSDADASSIPHDNRQLQHEHVKSHDSIVSPYLLLPPSIFSWNNIRGSLLSRDGESRASLPSSSREREHHLSSSARGSSSCKYEDDWPRRYSSSSSIDGSF